MPLVAFAYAISWWTPSSVCACLISDMHSGQYAPFFKQIYPICVIFGGVLGGNALTPNEASDLTIAGPFISRISATQFSPAFRIADATPSVEIVIDCRPGRHACYLERRESRKERRLANQHPSAHGRALPRSLQTVQIIPPFCLLLSQYHSVEPCTPG